MKAKLGIGIVGAGRAGLIHARNFARKIKHAAVVAVADPSASQRAAFCEEIGECAQYSEPEALLANPEVNAIVITAPTSLHSRITIAAAALHKHVFCEKPMARTVDECQSMCQAAEKSGIVLQIGFMRRFDRGFRRAWEGISSGNIGQVVQVKSITHGPSIPQPWMYDMSISNGPLAEVNSHDIDTLRWFTGSEFKEVYAVAGNYRSPEARIRYPDFYDNVMLMATFENGMQGLICGAQGVGYAYDARCEILGEKGLVTVGGLLETPTTLYTPTGVSSTAVRSWTDLFEDAYLSEDEAFADSILQDKPAQVSGRDGLAAVRVVQAGNQSIRTGKPVKISEIKN
jgi:myo-inositol 2-dehydrogenase/D-chiro-inositol 1-dehydrogenase/scyllo-inositol 2-dehydrogenase (NAD+)